MLIGPPDLQDQRVEVVRIDRPLLIGAGDLVGALTKASYQTDTSTGLMVHVDADRLEVLADDLSGLQQLRILRQAEIFDGEAIGIAGLGQESLGLLDVLIDGEDSGQVIPRRTRRHFLGPSSPVPSIGDVADVGAVDRQRDSLADLELSKGGGWC